MTRVLNARPAVWAVGEIDLWLLIAQSFDVVSHVFEARVAVTAPNGDPGTALGCLNVRSYSDKRNFATLLLRSEWSVLHSPRCVCPYIR